MTKTTVYLTETSKRALRRLARSRGRSQSSLIREAVEELLRRKHISHSRRPTIPLFESGQPDLAERVDEALVGFGQ